MIKVDQDYRHTTTGDVVTVVDVTSDYVQVWCEKQARFWMVDRARFLRWFTPSHSRAS